MALRHTPRQPERDIRLHDPHAHHSHSLPPPPHALGQAPPHLNGHTVPNTPLAGGPAPPTSMATSPAAPSGSTNPVPASIRKLAEANEQTWLLIGRVAEQMGNLEHALSAYENALRHNPTSRAGLTQVAGIARIKENYPKAVEYFQRVLTQDDQNGEVWSALGHCYLMQDDLQKAYSAYQQALYLLPNPKEDPKLWYGIGILYDRYGSLDHAEEAFASVLRMDKDFDKANEILFRLGIIYKQQGKFDESLQCFDRILRNPPNPLAHADIWFQIGHVYEQQEDHVRAREAYERVVADNPTHAKVLQQLGWLYHQDGTNFQNQEVAINYLTKSLEADPSDAQSWYLLGRAYMAGQKYNKAYEAYQQAVYRDGRNPTFWCSIGVLYFQINQYRDALDAYSRAIRINPYISEVWFDLGSLYESCNNQITDAIDAYARAAELDPSNAAIAQRLQLLRNAQITGNQPPPAPGPQDVHPTAYANPVMPQPAGLSGPPLLLQSGAGPRPLFRADSRGPPNELPLPHPPPQMQAHNSPGPYRGGPPPALVLDDNQRPPPHALAPMDVDRPPIMREPGYQREGGPRSGPGSMLLHHPVPHQQGPHPHEQPYPRPIRMPSQSASPPPHHSRHPGFNDTRPPAGPGYNPHHSRSPRTYARQGHSDHHDRVLDWVEGEHEHRGRDPQRLERGPHPQQMYQSRPHSPAYPPYRGPSPRPVRDSPPEASPRNGFQRQYWDQKPIGPGARGRSPAPRGPIVDIGEPSGRRYDPRFDGRESQPRDFDNREPAPDNRYPDAGSPENVRMRQPPPPPPYAGSVRGASESPRMTNQAVLMDPKARGVRKVGVVGKDVKETEVPLVAPSMEAQKKDRKRRAPRRPKDEAAPGQLFPNAPGQQGYEAKPGSQGSPEPGSSTGSNGGSGTRSGQPSPTNSVHLPPARPLYEDYDEGVADALVDLSRNRPAGPPTGRSPPSATRPPNSGSSAMSPHSMSKHPGMGRPSPPVTAKRPLSPGPDEPMDAKRTRVGSVHRRNTSPGGGSRPSPIPFRQQPTSHSPEMRQEGRPPLDGPGAHSYPSSPSLPTMLPPHPRPVGSMSSHSSSNGGMPPPLNRSPQGSATSPTVETDRMQTSRSQSPAGPRMAAKRDIVLHNTGSPHNPVTKSTPSPASSHGSHGKLMHT